MSSAAFLIHQDRSSASEKLHIHNKQHLNISMVRRRIPVLLRRRSILSSSHEVIVNETSAIHHRCQRLHQWWGFSVRCACITTTSNSVSLINNQTLVFHRWYHSNSEQNIDVGIGIANSNQMDDSTKHMLPNEKRRVDPFAKRPSQKCDPYGLAGQSLSYDECQIGYVP
jgi:hypothetical protein